MFAGFQKFWLYDVFGGRHYMWCWQIIASLYLRWKLLRNKFAWTQMVKGGHIHGCMFLPWRPCQGWKQYDDWQAINNIYVWHRIEKAGMVCFWTCRGWPTWPIQGSLMLQISKVGISPILQQRESYPELGILNDILTCSNLRKEPPDW